jgi:hypothetical protein
MEPCQVKAPYPQKNQGNTKGDKQPVRYSELVFVKEVYRYLQGEKGIEKTRTFLVTGGKKQENEREYNPDDDKDYARFFSVVHISSLYQFAFIHITLLPSSSSPRRTKMYASVASSSSPGYPLGAIFESELVFVIKTPVFPTGVFIY